MSISLNVVSRAAVCWASTSRSAIRRRIGLIGTNSSSPLILGRAAAVRLGSLTPGGQQTKVAREVGPATGRVGRRFPPLAPPLPHARRLLEQPTAGTGSPEPHRPTNHARPAPLGRRHDERMPQRRALRGRSFADCSRQSIEPVRSPSRPASFRRRPAARRSPATALALRIEAAPVLEFSCRHRLRRPQPDSRSPRRQPLGPACFFTIFESVPATGAGRSTVALSLSISTTGSSFSTRSPTLLCHLPIWTSVIDSPTSGTLSSIGMGAAGTGGWGLGARMGTALSRSRFVP